jgi:SUMO ligase MMS21 Smc5/6 complex component
MFSIQKVNPMDTAPVNEDEFKEDIKEYTRVEQLIAEAQKNISELRATHKACQNNIIETMKARGWKKVNIGKTGRMLCLNRSIRKKPLTKQAFTVALKTLAKDDDEVGEILKGMESSRERVEKWELKAMEERTKVYNAK